jgi:hypothetical protein
MRRHSRHHTTLLLAVILSITGAHAAAAQLPRVGSIDLYGRSSVAESAIRAALGVRVGDSLTVPRDTLVARLRGVPGVRDAAVTAVCCYEDKAMLFIGIQESAAPAVSWHPAGSSDARLPAEIIRNDSIVSAAMMEGIMKGESGEDDSRGYTLFKYPAARSAQELYVTWVPSHVDALRSVLRTSGDAEHRALATELIPFAGPSPATAADLRYAMRDPSPGVRNNAMRALGVMGMYALQHPETGIEIPVAGFGEMLNSLVWTDRNKAAFALTMLSAPRSPSIMAELSKLPMQPLIDMARWTSPGHAAPGLIILGRIAGMKDDDIFAALEKDRETVIKAALTKRGN